MKITDGEKIIIIMLGDIYKKLAIGKNAGEVDSELVVSAVKEGRSWALEEYVEANEDDELIVVEVHDILAMWRNLECLYEEFSVADKKSIGKVKFDGFDGNNEPHYAIAKFMIDSMDLYSEFKGRNINSHSQRVERYKNMKERYDNEIGDITKFTPLKPDQVKRIINI